MRVRGGVSEVSMQVGHTRKRMQASGTRGEQGSARGHGARVHERTCGQAAPYSCVYMTKMTTSKPSTFCSSMMALLR